MKLNSILLLVICSISISINSSAQEHYEIFPLANGLHYSYSFYQRMEQWGFSTLFYSVSDSGNVEYIIGDSVKWADTLIIWNVRQIQNLVHQSGDSISLIRDTNTFSIYESLQNNHTLQCTATIWLFPVREWPLDVAITSSDSNLCRYSDSSETRYTLSNSSPSLGWTDSIWLSSANGMYQRTTSSYEILASRFYYTLNVKLTGKTTDVAPSGANVISDFNLFQNYPNPFNPATAIKYSLASHSSITLELFDCLGRKLLDIDRGFRSAGEHTVKLDLNNLPAGVYFYKLTTGRHSATRKLVLLK